MNQLTIQTKSFVLDFMIKQGSKRENNIRLNFKNWISNIFLQIPLVAMMTIIQSLDLCWQFLLLVLHPQLVLREQGIFFSMLNRHLFFFIEFHFKNLHLKQLLFWFFLKCRLSLGGIYKTGKQYKLLFAKISTLFAATAVEIVLAINSFEKVFVFRNCIKVSW